MDLYYASDYTLDASLGISRHVCELWLSAASMCVKTVRVIRWRRGPARDASTVSCAARTGPWATLTAGSSVATMWSAPARRMCPVLILVCQLCLAASPGPSPAWADATSRRLEEALLLSEVAEDEAAGASKNFTDQCDAWYDIHSTRYNFYSI